MLHNIFIKKLKFIYYGYITEYIYINQLKKLLKMPRITETNINQNNNITNTNYFRCIPKICLYGLIILATLILIQYCALEFDIGFKPAYYLNFVKDILVNFFTSIGVYFVYISRFLRIIKLEKLCTATIQILEPIFISLISYLYVFKGYFNTAMSYVNDTYLIYTGSIILICLTHYLCYRFIAPYRQYIKRF